MRRLITTSLSLVAVFAAFGGAISTSGAQAGGWQIPGASTEVAVYANGITVHMNIHHINLSPSPGELAAAQPLYVVVFPVNFDSSRTRGAVTINGYQPQCNPCFHPGLPLPLVYHDHVLNGTPASLIGTNAADWQATRHPTAVMYNPAYVFGGNFKALTTVAAVKAGEQAGLFLPINGGAANPYELPQDVMVTVQLVAIS